jgi:hypothetical protein
MTTFERYWLDVFGSKTPRQLCRTYGLSEGDLVSWVDVMEGRANMYGGACTAQALALLQAAEREIHEESLDGHFEICTDELCDSQCPHNARTELFV